MTYDLCLKIRYGIRTGKSATRRVRLTMTMTINFSLTFERGVVRVWNTGRAGPASNSIRSEINVEVEVRLNINKGHKSESKCLMASRMIMTAVYYRQVTACPLYVRLYVILLWKTVYVWIFKALALNRERPVNTMICDICDSFERNALHVKRTDTSTVPIESKSILVD